MKTKISIELGDIVNIKDYDVIVNAANENIQAGGGVDGAIRQQAGPRLEEEIQEKKREMIVHYNKRRAKKGEPPVQVETLDVSDAIITKSYGLKNFSAIVHTVPPCLERTAMEPTTREREQLACAYKNALRLCHRRGWKKIVFPILGTGYFNYPLKDGIEVALTATLEYFASKDSRITHVLFVNNKAETVAEFKRIMGSEQLRLRGQEGAKEKLEERRSKRAAEVENISANQEEAEMEVDEAEPTVERHEMIEQSQDDEDVNQPGPSSTQRQCRAVSVSSQPSRPLEVAHDDAEVMSWLKQPSVRAAHSSVVVENPSDFCPLCLKCVRNCSRHWPEHFDFPEDIKNDKSRLESATHSVRAWRTEFVKRHLVRSRVNFLSRARLLEACKGLATEQTQGIVDLFYSFDVHVVPFTLRTLAARPVKYAVTDADLNCTSGREAAESVDAVPAVPARFDKRPRDGYTAEEDIGDMNSDESARALGYVLNFRAKGTKKVGKDTVCKANLHWGLNIDMCPLLLSLQVDLDAHSEKLPSKQITKQQETRCIMRALAKVFLVAQRLRGDYHPIVECKDIPFDALPQALSRFCCRMEALNSATGCRAAVQNFRKGMKHLIAFLASEGIQLSEFQRRAYQDVKVVIRKHEERANAMMHLSLATANRDVMEYGWYMSLVRELFEKWGHAVSQQLESLLDEHEEQSLSVSSGHLKSFLAVYWDKYTALLAAIVIWENGQRPEVMYKLKRKQLDDAEEVASDDRRGDRRFYSIPFPQNKMSNALQAIIAESKILRLLKSYARMRDIICVQTGKDSRAKDLLFVSWRACRIDHRNWGRQFQALFLEVTDHAKFGDSFMQTAMHVRRAACNTNVVVLIDLKKMPDEAFLTRVIQGHSKQTQIRNYFTAAQIVAVKAYQFLRKEEKHGSSVTSKDVDDFLRRETNRSSNVRDEEFERCYQEVLISDERTSVGWETALSAPELVRGHLDSVILSLSRTTICMMTTFDAIVRALHSKLCHLSMNTIAAIIGDVLEAMQWNDNPKQAVHLFCSALGWPFLFLSARVSDRTYESATLEGPAYFSIDPERQRVDDSLVFVFLLRHNKVVGITMPLLTEVAPTTTILIDSENVELMLRSRLMCRAVAKCERVELLRSCGALEEGLRDLVYANLLDDASELGELPAVEEEEEEDEPSNGALTSSAMTPRQSDNERRRISEGPIGSLSSPLHFNEIFVEQEIDRKERKRRISAESQPNKGQKTNESERSDDARRRSRAVQGSFSSPLNLQDGTHDEEAPAQISEGRLDGRRRTRRIGVTSDAKSLQAHEDFWMHLIDQPSLLAGDELKAELKRLLGQAHSLPAVVISRTAVREVTAMSGNLVSGIYPFLSIICKDERSEHMEFFGTGVSARAPISAQSIICRYHSKLFHGKQAHLEEQYAKNCNVPLSMYAIGQGTVTHNGAIAPVLTNLEMKFKSKVIYDGCSTREQSSQSSFKRTSHLFGPLLNHSLTHPNCKVTTSTIIFEENRKVEIVVLVATRNIRTGDELCWDYEDGGKRSEKYFLGAKDKPCPCSACLGCCSCVDCGTTLIHGSDQKVTANQLKEAFISAPKLKRALDLFSSSGAVLASLLSEDDRTLYDIGAGKHRALTEELAQYAKSISSSDGSQVAKSFRDFQKKFGNAGADFWSEFLKKLHTAEDEAITRELINEDLVAGIQRLIKALARRRLLFVRVAIDGSSSRSSRLLVPKEENKRSPFIISCVAWHDVADEPRYVRLLEIPIRGI